MTICEYIDSIIKERGISRRKLAISAGISPPSLQSAFARNTKMSLDMLIPIAKVLNLDWKEIVKCGGYNDSISDFFRKNPDKILVFDDETGKLLSKLSFDKKTSDQDNLSDETITEFTEQIRNDSNVFRLMINYNQLNPVGKETAVERVKELTEIPRYQKEQKEKPQTAGEPSEAE